MPVDFSIHTLPVGDLLYVFLFKKGSHREPGARGDSAVNRTGPALQGVRCSQVAEA